MVIYWFVKVFGGYIDFDWKKWINLEGYYDGIFLYCSGRKGSVKSMIILYEMDFNLWIE